MSDVKALARLLAYAKLEAARLGLWDAAVRINDSLRCVPHFEDGVVETNVQADEPAVGQAAE